MSRAGQGGVALRRRELLSGSLGTLALTLVPLRLAAAPVPLAESLRANFGERPVRGGRVRLAMPPLAENGNSVSMEIEVESPMTAVDHVRSLYVFSEKNPNPDVARFHFTPQCGRARVATRIRLADTQAITAVAEMSDDSLWAGTAEVIVTLAACIEIN
jgi:sulfur-oxidizing protein SoxY